MVMLTIDSLKNALNYINENGKKLKYYDGHYNVSKAGLIVTDEMTEEEAYHIRVVEFSNPKLVTKLAGSFTVLSIVGQELLDILSDDNYLNSLSAYLKKQGYSNPSDRQIFRLVCERMSGENTKSWVEMMQDIIDLAQIPKQEDILTISTEDVELLAVEEDVVEDDSLTEKIIKDTKKKVK